MFGASIAKKVLRVSVGALVSFGISTFAQTTPQTPEKIVGTEVEASLPDCPTAARASSNISRSPTEILSDTRGVDFGPYLKQVVPKIRASWYSLIPEKAKPPLVKRGKVVLDFAILKDGRISGLRYAQESGDPELDLAAFNGVSASSPLPPLPAEFGGTLLNIRFAFLYNSVADDYKYTPQVGTAYSERVKLSEILVYAKGMDSSGSPEIAAARAKTDALLEKIHGGAKFEDVARTNSDGLTAAQGGDIGYFPRGMLAKSIDDTVFAMKIGDVSGVIRTKQGFIILKVTDHRGADDKALPTSGIQ